MPPQPQTLAETLRVIRIVHVALALFIVLYVVAIEGVLVPAAHLLSQTFYEGIAIVALLCIGAAFVVRYRTLRPALETLRTNPVDAASHKGWRAGSLISFALAIAVVMFGGELRKAGASPAQAAPFYVVGSALILLWWPRHP
ncbi:MAG: hypothetical protein ACRD4R_10160 [Candidatus Acidiferrales bacterium]